MAIFKLLPDESVLFSLTPDEATLLFYLLGVAAAQPLTIDEINVLANGLFEMSQVMFVVAAQRTFINDASAAQQKQEEAEKAKEKEKSHEKLEVMIKELQFQMKQMQKQIDALKK
ncbi:Hypothetical protein LUCI_2560 [Lucifera butyrica]|uniref:Uncharacterized protein n=1 Tax=Lucifera butyrica TaxID=1351585 RepID=A0A498R3S3_9FIRM|nr:hypothetical protein [Lucifera butyrica]VBB07316.1 Hypothetical protein LUCI_2560 [Lucifera butyrica]